MLDTGPWYSCNEQTFLRSIFALTSPISHLLSPVVKYRQFFPQCSFQTRSMKVIDQDPFYSMDQKNEANDMYITCINKAFFLCNEKDKGGRGFSGDKNLILFTAGTT